MEENEVIDDAQDDADFASGLSETPTATASQPTATPAADKVVDPAPAVVEAPKYAQITEDELNDLRTRAARIDEIKATQDKSFGTAFGKIGGIERVLADLKAGGALGELSVDDFTELKEQFPELAEMQVAGLNRALAKMKAPVSDPAQFDAKVQELLAPVIARAEAAEQLAQASERRLLTKAHPDWQAVVALPKFGEWAATQPEETRQMLASGWDADAIGQALTAFKKATAPAVAPQLAARKGVMAAAVTPRGTGGHAPGNSEDDDFNAGFNSPR